MQYVFIRKLKIPLQIQPKELLKKQTVCSQTYINVQI